MFDAKSGLRSAVKPSTGLRVLVLYAHPDRNSLSGAILQAAVRGLEKAGHQVNVLDLCGEHFQAAMSPAERAVYETDTPVLDPQVQRYIDLLKASDALVAVYPTWNMGMPAILKGWFERILVPGVGFSLDPETKKVVSGLGHLKHLVGISTYGMPRVGVFVINDAGRRLLTRCIRAMVPNTKCHTHWLGLYGLNRANPAQIVGFIGRVEREMAKL